MNDPLHQFMMSDLSIKDFKLNIVNNSLEYSAGASKFIKAKKTNFNPSQGNKVPFSLHNINDRATP